MSVHPRVLRLLLALTLAGCSSGDDFAEGARGMPSGDDGEDRAMAEGEGEGFDEDADDEECGASKTVAHQEGVRG